MKKTYQKPIIDMVSVTVTSHLLDASQGGVATGGTLGNGYNPDDVNYSRHGSDLWDDDDE